MRVISRALLAAGLLGAMLWPGQAHALLVSECGGTYSGTTTCMFAAVGPTLSVSGYTTVAGIVVRVSDATGTVRILSCHGQSSCDAVAGIDPTGTDSVGPPPGVGPLLCTVITSGSGSFRCQSST
jgi:hypothetical protein